MIVPRHATNFMLDFKDLDGESHRNLQEFIKKEPGYDLAFCKAWHIIDSVKDEHLSNQKEFLSLLIKYNNVR